MEALPRLGPTHHQEPMCNVVLPGGIMPYSLPLPPS
jgi:hypothetical protein